MIYYILIFPEFAINNAAIRTNIKTKGKITKNHESFSYPVFTRLEIGYPSVRLYLMTVVNAPLAILQLRDAILDVHLKWPWTALEAISDCPPRQ